jgi:hypothetical protein
VELAGQGTWHLLVMQLVPSVQEAAALHADWVSLAHAGPRGPATQWRPVLQSKSVWQATLHVLKMQTGFAGSLHSLFNKHSSEPPAPRVEASGPFAAPTVRLDVPQATGANAANAKSASHVYRPSARIAVAPILAWWPPEGQ